MPNVLKILTFNIWDMPIWLPKINREKRLTRIPSEIMQIDPDIILLQESFKIQNRRRLCSSLEEAYYHSNCFNERRLFPFIKADITGGLITFSKFQINQTEFFPHPLLPNMRFDEKIGKKGTLFTEIEIEGKKLVAANTHLYAGRSPRDSEIREYQLEHIIAKLATFSEFDLVLMGGDFNSSPTSPYPADAVFTFNREYQKLLDHAFIDTMDAFDKSTITYDVFKNKYARLFYNVSKTPQRFAYTFIKSSNKIVVKSFHSRVVFNYSNPLSDHYALLTTLVLS